MELSDALRDRRKSLGLGVRELCREANSLSDISITISPSYYSQIELEEVDIARISIDKFWTLGRVLRIHPLQLFALAQGNLSIPKFAIRDTSIVDFSKFIRERREEIGMGTREAARKGISATKGKFSVSPSYLSQLEGKKNVDIKKVSGKKLWAIGCEYDVDPLLLFVQSRKLNKKYLLSKERNALFDNPELQPIVQKIEVFDDFEDEKAMEGYKFDTVLLSSRRSKQISEKRKLKDQGVCQICGFHLMHRGKFLIECHHLKPVSEGSRTTKLSDLISLCPTCHRIAHLKNPPYVPDEIKGLLKKSKTSTPRQ